MNGVKTERQHHFDMIKGVAIFMVVMGHVITMCVREIDRAPLFKFIEQLHMPLFFFVSGWFCCKVSDNKCIAVPPIKPRAIRLLLPMVFVSSLWVIYYPHSGLLSPLNSTFAGLWSDPWKNGYWFTLVLFELIILYSALVPILNKYTKTSATAGILLLVWLLLHLAVYLCPAWLVKITSLELAATFYPIFIFGAQAGRYSDKFTQAIRNSTVQTVAIVVFAVSLYHSCWWWEFGYSPIVLGAIKAALHISMAVILYVAFERWSKYACAPGASATTRRAASLCAYLGTQSLGIYLLHYFFLFPMGKAFRSTLAACNVSFVPMLIFSAFWAACIIAVVLLLIKVIEQSKLLSLLLTGRKQ